MKRIFNLLLLLFITSSLSISAAESKMRYVEGSFRSLNSEDRMTGGSDIGQKNMLADLTEFVSDYNGNGKCGLIRVKFRGFTNDEIRDRIGCNISGGRRIMHREWKEMSSGGLEYWIQVDPGENLDLSISHRGRFGTALVPGISVNAETIYELTIEKNEELRITISAIPADTHITIDNTYLGQSPQTLLVPSGTHTVVYNYGNREETRQIEVGPSKTYFEIDMRREVLVKIDTPEQGARLHIDGKDVGAIPGEYRIEEGLHELEAYTILGSYCNKLIKITNTTTHITMESNRQTSPSEANLTNNSNTRTIKVGNVEFKMIKVEGGSFDMGATAEQGDDAKSNEKPVHRVTLDDYFIGETEVTQALWKAIMGSIPVDEDYVAEDLPVHWVNWYDCQEFIEKLNAKTGLEFRLPTEAEWEYAARGGNKSKGYKYAGSDYIEEVAWYKKNNGKTIHNVKGKQPNELGIYDMSGNVWEWCSDWYDKKYYKKSVGRNPQGAESGSYRVLRGGSWARNARECRVSYRNDFLPDWRYHASNGLRLVLIVR